MAQPAPNNTINYFLHTTFNYPDDGRGIPGGGAEGVGSVFRE
jgi:hypothetical protein